SELLEALAEQADSDPSLHSVILNAVIESVVEIVQGRMNPAGYYSVGRVIGQLFASLDAAATHSAVVSLLTRGLALGLPKGYHGVSDMDVRCGRLVEALIVEQGCSLRGTTLGHDMHTLLDSLATQAVRVFM
ncbi:hypothetical protein KIPB_012825, partial [Kipferlia bialata]